MTAKEKAKELVNKFWLEITPHLTYSIAKYCALIAVEEILAEANNDGFSWNINCYWNGEKYIAHKEWKEFWQSVKTEIEKL